MTIQFKPAIRENVGLLVGMIGPSGGGKTLSAFRLAKGICGDKPFAVIDTEARRALHYADMFRFDHAELKPPFRPQSYWEAIKAADDAGYPVIIVDSMSHEHAGEGGLLDWHDEVLDDLVEKRRKQAESKGWSFEEWKVRESLSVGAWNKPKSAHKRMIQQLLQIRAPLILCFRAEEKIKMVKDDNGKTQIVQAGFQPICEKNLPYELTCSFLLTPDAPGFPHPLKLQKQHRSIFPTDKPIDEASGKLLAEWAAGKGEQK